MFVSSQKQLLKSTTILFNPQTQVNIISHQSCGTQGVGQQLEFIFSRVILISKKHFVVSYSSQTHDLGELTTLLFFLLKISVYLFKCFFLLMIHERSKMRSCFIFWLSAIKFQTPKYIENNCDRIFLDFTSFLHCHFPHCV